MVREGCGQREEGRGLSSEDRRGFGAGETCRVGLVFGACVGQMWDSGRLDGANGRFQYRHHLVIPPPPAGY